MTSLATAPPPGRTGPAVDRVGASPAAQSSLQSPLPSDATNEDRFRYHLSLELRRHGIEPTPALVETALRTHYANLAAAEADNVSGDSKTAASPHPSTSAEPEPKKALTPTQSFPMDKPPSATSPSSASDSSGVATPPHDSEWNTYLNDIPADQDRNEGENKLSPPKVKSEEAPFGTDNFLTDMDYESTWGLGMQVPASPLPFDPLATPQLAEPNFPLPPEINEAPAPPPYDPQPVKNEDTTMEEAMHLLPGASTDMTSQLSGATLAASPAPNGHNCQNTTIDPTSIDPRLVQMTLAEQINMQLQVLQELQAQSAGQQGLVPPQTTNTSSPQATGAPIAAPTNQEESAADLDITLDPIPSRPRMLSGNGREASPGSSNGGNVRGIPASMSALSAADRPSAEQYKALSSKEKRQLRNKISARNFRERRKEYITQLEDLLAQRDAAIETLRSKNATLTEENQRYKALLEQHQIDVNAQAEVPPAPREASPVAAPAPAPAPEPAAAPTPKQGQYDVGKILEILRRTQGPSTSRADAPRLSRQSSSSQGLSEMAPTLNLSSTLNIPPMSGPSSPMPLTSSPVPRFPEVNTKKDVAYPASPRALSRTQSFFGGRPSGSSGSFAAPITQVHSMFAPNLPVAPFMHKTDVMTHLVHSFDSAVALARSKRTEPMPEHVSDVESHVRSLAMRAAAECLADADNDSIRELDGLPSYSQALRSPVLY